MPLLCEIEIRKKKFLKLTVGEFRIFWIGWVRECPISIDSKASFWGLKKEALGLIKCSKMAMMRNMEINIAVAANPKEIAFIDVPKSFQEASLSTGSDTVGSPLHGFDDLSSKPSMILDSVVLWKMSTWMLLLMCLIYMLNSKNSTQFSPFFERERERQ